MIITDFLTARLDEDEAVAKRADDFEVDEFTWASVSYWCTSNEDHGLRWKPAHVLADVAAKRAIVVMHSDTHECTGPTLVSDPGLQDGDYGGPCNTLRLLAQPYAKHEDYDEGWKP